MYLMTYYSRGGFIYENSPANNTQMQRLKCSFNAFWTGSMDLVLVITTGYNPKYKISKNFTNNYVQKFDLCFESLGGSFYRRLEAEKRREAAC